jgi:flagellar protein FliJ
MGWQSFIVLAGHPWRSYRVGEPKARHESCPCIKQTSDVTRNRTPLSRAGALDTRMTRDRWKRNPLKTLDSQIRQKHFRVDKCQRRVAQLEGMIVELQRRSGELERDLNLEHGRTKISDPNHFAYSPLAKSLSQSQTNLERSIQTFEVQLEDEKSAVSETLRNLNDLLQERERWEGHTRWSTETSTDVSVPPGSTLAAVII